MKRTTAYPECRSKGELKLSSQKQYNQMVKEPSKIKPVFLQDHYGIKEVSHDRSN